MSDGLSQIFRIQKYLEGINYPDTYRSAREISQFLSSHKNISETDLLNRIKMGEPLEYICGYTTFCESTFKITADTLIPRIESEQIVYDTEIIIRNLTIKNIIDVGTGSGCLIISLVKLFTCGDYSFWGTDISEKALEVAEHNEKCIFNKGKINWIRTDLIKDIPKLKGPIFIIANLPYIPTKQYQKLDNSVKGYEPRNALDGGKDGLKYYRKLFKQIKQKHMNIKGLYIETEESIFNTTRDLIRNNFPDSLIQEKRDCFGTNRFIFSTLPEQE